MLLLAPSAIMYALCVVHQMAVPANLAFHAFMLAASRHLKRTITVREPKMVHTFTNGRCSCGGRWRWEARHPRPDTGESLRYEMTEILSELCLTRV